jgi:TonB family protein
LSGIFVSYRRSDSQGEAGRLFDDLVKHFGEQTVFMDVAAIEAGRDFRKAIEEGVTKCGVLLVVIGLEWLDTKDEHGARRLNDPSDFVRIETASALKRDIAVIPVLVRGARMPTAEQLPDELKELAYRNCIELTHARWRSDVQLLIDALRRLLGDTTPAATSPKPNEASAQPGASQQDLTPRPKVEDGSSARIDPDALQRVTRELALRIGPIAGIVVKRAALQCSSLDELYLKVAEEIDSRDEREKFLQKRASIPSPSPPLVASAKSAPNKPPPASPLPHPPESRDVPSKTSTTTAPVGSSNRGKYWIVAVAVGVFLVLLFVLVMHFASSRGPGSSQTAQTSSPALPPAEIPAKGHKAVHPSGTPPSNEREHVRVPQELSKDLLVKPPLPDYPVLARQGRIQGLVVLDAYVSKDGTIESLKVISGHPLLVGSALEAAKQARYKPFVQNGEPVAMVTQIIINFTLKGG